VEFTADAKALLAAIARLRHAPPQIGSGGDMQCPSFTPYQAYVVAHHQDQRAKDVATAEAIACYCVGGDESCPKAQPATAQGAAETMWGQFESQSTNALDQLRAVVQHLAGTPGSRLLILISNGFPAGDMYQRTNAIIDAALAARIVVNALNSEGLMGQSPEARGASDGIRYRWATETSRMRQTILSELMSSVSAATGGQMILNNNDLTGALKKLTDTPETSYLLGFAPAGAPDGKYHVLKLVLKKSDGFRVESRPGYFAARLGKKTETAQQRIDRVMLSKETLQEIPAIVRVTAAPAGVLVLVNVDAKPLKFVNQGDKNVQQLTFVAVVQDASGNYVTGKQSVMDLALSTARLAVLQAEGIRTTETFSVPPGEYQVRLLIREAVQNHMAASNTAVEVH
jgi:VWFA-related protein